MSRRRPSGFTLLEVLVASVLVGSVFVAVVSVMSQSLRNIDRMGPHERAMQHAREKMNEQLLRVELEPGTSGGDWGDGYRWRLDVTPYPVSIAGIPVDPQARPQPGAPALFQVRVEVQWGEAKAPRTYPLQTTQWARYPVPKQP